MNKESDEMSKEAEILMSELAILREKKNNHFYTDILRKDYVENLFDTSNT